MVIKWIKKAFASDGDNSWPIANITPIADEAYGENIYTRFQLNTLAYEVIVSLLERQNL